MMNHMLEVDRSVPALLVRTGVPMWDYGALATVRSLGRLGVDVHALAMPGERELLTSRYLKGVVGAPLDPADDVGRTVARLNGAVAVIGARCVAIAGDDESAVLLAEQREAIEARLLTAEVPGFLPRSLSDKVSLGVLAAAADVPYPPFVHSEDVDRLADFAHRTGVPLVAKSPAPFTRLKDSAVTKTTVIHDLADLDVFMEAAREGYRIFLQKYLTGSGGQTWYAAGVSSGAEVRVWTGRKMLDCPGQSGIGVMNVARPNEAIVGQVSNFVRSIGYLGAFDTDWVSDSTTGQTYLIDFNPRRGAQFRTFQTHDGLDVVRGLHLALTAGRLPNGEQDFGLVHTVENLALLRGAAGLPWRYRDNGLPIEYSWYARDDPAPARAIAEQTVRRLRRKVRQRFARRRSVTSAFGRRGV